MSPARPPSIKSQLATRAFSLLAVAVLSLVLIFIALIYVDQRTAVVRKAEGQATSLAEVLSLSLTLSDRETARQTLARWASVPEIRTLAAYTPSGQIFAEIGKPRGDDGAQPPASALADSIHGDLLGTHIVRPIRLDGEQLGSLDLEIDFDSLYHRIFALATAMLLSAFLVLAIAWMALKNHASRALEPLVEFASVLKTVARSRNFSARANERGPSELVELARTFNTIVDAVQHRFERLDQELREKTMNEAQLDHLAHFDQVTGLPNRTQFHKELPRAAERTKRQGTNFAVVFLDLDDFKVVNDTLGHDMGDQLLFEVGKRLTETVRKADLVCRLGGDEFTVLLEGITSLSTVVDIVSKLIEVLAKGFEIDNQTLHVKASAGIALFPAQTDDVRNILRLADLAMYQAKNDGKNSYCVYTSNLATVADERRVIESELRQGIENDEFFLVYQPQVAIQSGRIEGMEALLRWQNPRRGLVAPGDFIDVAEKSGLIVPLGRKVIAMACAQWKEWRDQGIYPPRLAVNVSGLQLREESFAEELMATLTACGYPRPRLELEITESLLLSDTRVSKAMMHRLASSGIEWSLDDFGTGYSSLTYLTKFPIKKIKIDRSFITNLPGHRNSEAIVTAVVAMARGLGMRVVTEGVETLQQVEYLATMGDLVAQGYYYHRPLPALEMTKLLLDPEALDAP